MQSASYHTFLRADARARTAWGQFKQRLARTAIDFYTYGQIKQPDTEALMIAAEDWARRTGWTDPSREPTPARTGTEGIPYGRCAGQVVLSGSLLGKLSDVLDNFRVGCRECGAGSVLGIRVATTGHATQKENHHDDSADGQRPHRCRRS